MRGTLRLRRDMEHVEITVFISYRRTNIPWALAISQNLTQHGYDAVNLDGGMLAWASAGRPMISEDGAAPRVA